MEISLLTSVGSFFAWWGIIQIMGWLALPLCMRVFAWLPDRGYTASKAVGLMLSTYLLWLGASAGVMTNTLGGALTAILGVAALSAFAALPIVTSGEISQFLKDSRRMVISAEVLFLLAFAAWTLVRAYAPDKIMSAGGEKWMEIAFLNGILNSPSFPPQDPWLSGFAISYYYFGYVMMALLTRLSGVAATVGFELYDALLFALAALGSYGVVYNLIQSTQKGSEPDEAGSAASAFAFLGPFLLLIMSNLEGALESLHSAGRLPQGFTAWLNIPDLANAPVNNSFDPGLSNGWWWWRASRVLQEFNLNGEPHGLSPITEFPFFSFLLGDNHPHVLGLPFVLLAIAFAFNIFLRTRFIPTAGETDQPQPAGWLASLNPLKSPLEGGWHLFIFGGLLFGGLAFLNTWDFPIYLGLCIVAFLAGRLASGESLSSAIKPAGLLAAGWLVPAIGLYFFFYLSFNSQAGGILPYIFPPTRLPQYFVMFAAFVVIVGGFLVALLFTYESELLRPVLRGWGLMAALGAGLILLVVLLVAVSGILSQVLGIDPALISNGLGGLPPGDAAMRILLDRLSNPWLFILLSALCGIALGPIFFAPSIFSRFSSATAFTLILIGIGFGLTWVPEFLYLRDHFGVRMNTVFKFYLQAWVMLSCAGAYALWWLASSKGSSVLRATILAAALVPVVLGLVYPILAIPARTNSFTGTPNLDGASSLARYYADDWALIAWLQDNGHTNGQAVPVILEAPGLSYNYEGRISAFTGFPTVLGWSLHEGQWRGDYVEQNLRRPDIETIYTSSDPDLTLDLLHKWQVRFVVLSSSERTYIQQVCSQASRACNPTTVLRKFDKILTPVFSQGNATLYAVP